MTDFIELDFVKISNLILKKCSLVTVNVILVFAVYRTRPTPTRMWSCNVTATVLYPRVSWPPPRAVRKLKSWSRWTLWCWRSNQDSNSIPTTTLSKAATPSNKCLTSGWMEKRSASVVLTLNSNDGFSEGKHSWNSYFFLFNTSQLGSTVTLRKHCHPVDSFYPCRII